jgi:hypothetical protein
MARFGRDNIPTGRCERHHGLRITAVAPDHPDPAAVTVVDSRTDATETRTMLQDRAGRRREICDYDVHAQVIDSAALPPQARFGILPSMLGPF